MSSLASLHFHIQKINVDYFLHTHTFTHLLPSTSIKPLNLIFFTLTPQPHPQNLIHQIQPWSPTQNIIIIPKSSFIPLFLQPNNYFIDRIIFFFFFLLQSCIINFHHLIHQTTSLILVVIVDNMNRTTSYYQTNNQCNI